jgi:phage shock protein PspC (stress-responsive transcriptional regulator)
MNQPADGQLRQPLGEWSRDPEEKKIAGVCAGISSQLGLPVTAVRAIFVLLALPHFSSVGIVLYLILWFLMPARPGEGSGLDRVVAAVSRLAGDDFSGRSEDEDDPRDRAPSYHDPL